MNRRLSAIHGFLIIDKPAGLTSRAVVDRAARWFPRGTRIGHTGTLDPLATGVLVLAIGKGTRLTEYVQDQAKTYATVLLLGARSDTDDADGTIIPTPNAPVPKRAEIAAALRHFLGDIDQVPPAYSAAHVGGRRAYQLARQGKDVPLLPRRVRIDRIDIQDFNYPRLELTIACGKGTYIRSLARDLGDRLGSGALVERLRRTRVGPFQVSEGISLEADAATVQQHVLPLVTAVVDLPHITLGPAAAIAFRQGRRIEAEWLDEPADSPCGQIEAAVVDEAGSLIGIAVVDRENRLLAPSKVIPE